MVRYASRFGSVFALPMARAWEYRLCRLLGVQSVSVNMHGHLFWLDLEDGTLSRHYFINREYEAYQVALVERITLPGMTFVDVGAHIGYFSLIASRQVGERGHVIAFEPAPGNYALLLKNIKANRVENVRAVDAAALSYAGTAQLYLSGTNFGDHRVFDGQDEARFGERGRRPKIEVPAVRVDDILREERLTADIIKVDVQGAEMETFSGMQEALRSEEVVLFFEFWPYGLRKANTSPRALLDYVRNLGLEIVELDELNWRAKPVVIDELASRFPDFGLANLLCARRQRLSTLLSRRDN